MVETKWMGVGLGLRDVGLCALVSISVYITSLNCGFVFDDSSAIVKNYDLRPSHPWTEIFYNDFWGTPMIKERSHKSYRPITVLTFRLNYLWNELQPFSYHLVNVVLHSIATCMFYLFLSKPTYTYHAKHNKEAAPPSNGQSIMERKSALIAALLFAVHPVHVEAVAGVVGRAEILAFVFSLGALFLCPLYASFFYQHPHVTSTKSFSLSFVLKFFLCFCAFTTVITFAMLCKETGITIVAIYAILDLQFVCNKTFKEALCDLTSLAPSKHGKKKEKADWLKWLIVRQLVLGVSLATLVAMRIWFVQGGKLPSFTYFDNPAAMAESPAKELTFNYLLPVNLWLLICPWWLCCDWSMGTIPLVQSFFDLRNTITLAFWVALLSACMKCYKSREKLGQQLSLAIAFMIFPFIPASNLFFPVGFVVAERVLYTPSAGYCILVALGWQKMMETCIKKFKNRQLTQTSLKVGLHGFLVLMLVTFSFRTALRNYDWEDEYSLFISAVRNNKMNAKCWNNVGHSLEGQSKFEEALGFFRHAALVQPDDAGALINVARTYKNLNMEDEAEKWFYYAIKLIPTADNADEADVNYTRMNPNYLFAFISLANMIKEDPNRFDEADKLYQRAYRMRYDQVEAYTNRGELLLRRNRTREAREMFVKARHYDEKNPDLWYNLGVSYLLENREAEAFPIFERALILDPSHRKSKYNYAALLFDIPSETEDNRNAIKAQKIMEELWDEDEKDHKVASRLATHFLHLKQKETALLWYERAAESGTDEITLFNFALTLSEMGRFEKALVYAQNALEMKPDYVKAYALKGDILTKMRKLVEANEAFEKALEFDPEHLISGHNLCVNKFNLHMPKVPVSVLECFEKFSKIAPPNHEIHNHFKRVLSQIKRN